MKKRVLSAVLVAALGTTICAQSTDWYKCDPKLPKPQCCDPSSDPNCFFALLPAAPPPPSTDQFSKLSLDVDVKKAEDMLSKLQSNPTGEVMDVGISILAFGYPPAGVALGFLKGIILDGASSGPDPLAQALQQINDRINDLQNDLKNLQSQIIDVRDDQYRAQNMNRGQWFFTTETLIKEAATNLRDKPSDYQIDDLISRLQSEADKYVDSRFQTLWYWNDVHVTAAPNAPPSTNLLPADFKSQPGMDHYAQVLTLWMQAMLYASKGDPKYILRRKDWVDDLLKHAAFLSVRDKWDGGRGSALTVPERVIARAQCGIQRTGNGFPDRQTGMCSAQVVCNDDQRRLYWTPAKYRGVTLTWRQGYDARSPQLCRMDGGAVAEAQNELLTQYGVDTMANLAMLLTRVGRTGSLATQFIGQFDMTFYTQQRLYAVKPTGELLMYRHVIGVDKNPPQPSTQPLPCSWKLGNMCLATTAIQRAAVTMVSSTQPNPGNRMLTSSAHLGAVRQAEPKVIHKLEGPFIVGSAWQQFRQVIPAGTGDFTVQTPQGAVPSGGTAFYAVANDGSLLWYRQDGIPNDKAPGGYSYQWKGPMKVATGFGAYKQIFSGGDGVIYAIGADGSLNQYRFSNFRDVNPSVSPVAPTRGGNPVSMGVAPQYQGPNRIATGWGNYAQVFSGGQGIIYAITQDGRLLWFKDLGAQGGLWRFNGPKQVGSGWVNMKRVFSPGDGVIYAISASGEVYWYKHEGYQDGTPRWQGPTKIASDWGTFVQAFPWMPTAAPPGAIH
jgi:hypothetical protein